MTQKNLEKLGYTGDMPGVGSTPTSRAIARDLAINPETTQFARSYIQSLAQPDINRFSTPIGPRAVNVPGATKDITFGDVPRGFNYLDVSDEDLYGTRSVAPSPFSTGYRGIAPMGIQGIDVELPGTDLMATLATNSPALAQYRSLQKKQRLSDFGGPEFTAEDQQKLDQLQQMEDDPVNVYSQTV